jgi:hypothetical protein
VLKTVVVVVVVVVVMVDETKDRHNHTTPGLWIGRGVPIAWLRRSSEF